MYVLSALAVMLSACADPASSGDEAANTPFLSGTPAVSSTPAAGDEEKLRSEYYDFAVKYRLDYVPFFTEGNAPADSTEYLYYAFAINLLNWGDDKGTMDAGICG